MQFSLERSLYILTGSIKERFKPYKIVFTASNMPFS